MATVATAVGAVAAVGTVVAVAVVMGVVVAAAAATIVARLKRFEIQTHCFSTLYEICWVAF